MTGGQALLPIYLLLITGLALSVIGFKIGKLEARITNQENVQSVMSKHWEARIHELECIIEVKRIGIRC